MGLRRRWNDEDVLVPVEVEGEAGHGVDEDGGELVQAVEDKAVLPHHNSQHQDAH